MTKQTILRSLVAGWAGGFAGNALLGALFSSPWVREILYNPEVQSQLFISLTPQRNIALSVAGLVVLSGLHGVLFAILRPSIPGESWIGKGVWWGLALWVVYWLAQEWFIYITLLGEPMGLAAFELGILLAGSLVEGVVIAGLLMRINGVRLD
ncbi:MAG TPA: hypothetical protein VM011_06425 [Gammaproteobacteria bacterium]|nr:hypothetical protein [Gammaproteobacteria bacterium]